MSLTYGFYNAIENEGVWDRRYNAEDVSRLFDGLINDGVYETIGNHFRVSPLSGLTVSVGTGRAWFDHTWTLNDAPITVTLAAAHSAYARIDAVCLQTDSSTRENSIVVVPGNPAASPVRPALTVTQHPLAYVKVNKNATTIKDADITNMIGSSSCPWVTGVVSVMDIDMMISQWEDQWDDWLAENQATFNTDVTTLIAETQSLITHLETEIDEVEHETGADLRPIIGYECYLEPTDWEQFEAEAGSFEESVFAAGYIYRAQLYLEGVIPAMRPYVTWDLLSIYGSKIDLLNVCQCTYNGVYVYSRNIPSTNIYALTVECRHS